jgi:hypothetical protein
MTKGAKNLPEFLRTPLADRPHGCYPWYKWSEQLRPRWFMRGNALVFASVCWANFGCTTPTIAPPLTIDVGRPTGATVTVDWGTLTQRERRTFTLTLHNSSAAPIHINTIYTSCVCLTTQPTEITVPAHGSVPLTVQVNLGHEPDFVGRLALEITGFTTPGAAQPTFAFTAKVNVVRPPA